MKPTALISSENGHTVLPAAVRKYLRVGKGMRIEFEPLKSGEMVIRVLPTLDALFGSLKTKGNSKPNNSPGRWDSRAERLMNKGRR